MSKRAEETAFTYAKENGTIGKDYDQIYDAVKYGYNKAQKEYDNEFLGGFITGILTGFIIFLIVLTV